jgi:hypothetical protein
MNLFLHDPEVNELPYLEQMKYANDQTKILKGYSKDLRIRKSRISLRFNAEHNIRERA